MKITLIEPQKNNPQRVNIFIDGNFFCGLSLMDVATNHLQEGQEVTDNDLRNLWSKSIKSKLKDDVLNLLSFRPRSEKETKDYLKKKLQKITEKNEVKAINLTDDEKLITEIVSELISKNLLNDIDFSRWWINQRQEFRPKGKRLIEYELLQKGVHKKNFEIAWSSSTEKKDEITLALNFLEKKANRLKNLDEKTKREKIFSWLTARGFSYETIKKVIDRERAKG